MLRSATVFVATGDGFSLDPSIMANPPVGAARLAGAWRGTQIRLPRDGRGLIGFRDPGGTLVEVREAGATGEGAPAEGAVAYRRMGGTSFWKPEAGGVEEWLHLAAGAARDGEAVASWDVSGATARQRGEAVELVDAVGVVRVRVTAPWRMRWGGERWRPGSRRVDRGSICG